MHPAVLTPSAKAAKGGPRLAVVTPPPVTITFSLIPPRRSHLRFAAGMEAAVQVPRALGPSEPADPALLEQLRRSDGMRFEVRVGGQTAWSRDVPPAVDRTASTWIEGEVDLSGFEGRETEIALVSLPGAAGDARGDLGGWADVRVVREETVARQPRDEDHPSVLVFLVDTLRADALGVYGNPRGTSPTLDRLARQSLVFDRATSVCSWTLPCVATLFTGLLPDGHGVLRAERGLLTSDRRTLGEICREAGIATAAFLGTPVVKRRLGFDQGFDTFVEAPSGNSNVIFRRCAAWLAEHRDEQVLAYIHSMEPHDPYVPLPPFQRRLAPQPYEGPFDGQRMSLFQIIETAYFGLDETLQGEPITWNDIDHIESLYLAEVAQWDFAFGSLVAGLRRQGLLENTVIIVTADHGEEFFDHGMLMHGHTLYEELIHVPLILWSPGRIDPGRVETPVSWAALARTICELLGVEPPPGSVGPSLLDVAAGKAQPGPAVSYTDQGRRYPHPEARVVRSIREGGYKALQWEEDGGATLFDLTADPREREDLLEPWRKRSLVPGTPGGTADADAIAKRLLEDLERIRREAARRQPANVVGMDPEMKAALEALGYVR